MTVAARIFPTGIPPLRREALEAPDSGIVEVFEHGFGRAGLIPLWAGEGDLPTPRFITDVAARSLAAGETFYTLQRGIPELREAISAYMSRIYGKMLGPERFFVTIGGMQAIQIAMRIACGNEDEVIVPTPAWPNFLGALTVSGAKPVLLPMQLERGRWHLDLDRIASAITPRTRVIVVNSPANPTGWTATGSELEAILELAQRHDLWIVADEIYGRFVYGGEARAPSFHDFAGGEERVLYAQTFSKNWAMTGWRVGWLEAPAALGATVENLVQYSTSGVATFVQRAAVTALEEGEPFIAEQIERARRGREIVLESARRTNRIELAPPEGGFYAFFRVAGVADARHAALDLVDEANVGVAPGTAFGPGGEGYFRLCYARKSEDIEEAMRRIEHWLSTRSG
ncbi:MAG: pyridoxal phosphate-dependent aminotransferase [Hyphomicrobiales bacterium]|nr:pyridoxal phosphate-dependent aminotransferase [Hyphomicrobiales bacterium]MBV9753997.1 pyridoxal phosphate-dependent aminotransferase [Hyphomicrobiales bacterium]